MLGVAAIREVKLLFPAIELAGATTFVRELVGEIVGGAREREQREDVLAQLRAREHRGHRIVMVARADQRLAVAVASFELERWRQRDGERGGASNSEALDHGVSFTMRASLRAWSAMWPFWMPSVASARRAARLVARPAAPASAVS